jgi:hypothetical protein
MGVANEWSDVVFETVFNRTIHPSTGCPIGIQQLLFAIRGLEFQLVSDDMLTKSGEVGFEFHT